MSQILTISNDLRTIDIPRDFVLGVESDDDVNRVYFSLPAMYGDTALWPYKIRINYMNANGEGDMYTVPDEDKEILVDSAIYSMSTKNAVAEIMAFANNIYTVSQDRAVLALYYHKPEEPNESYVSLWFDMDTDTIYAYRLGLQDQQWHNIETEYSYDTNTREWSGYSSADSLKTVLRLIAHNWTVNENAIMSYSENMPIYVARSETAENSFLTSTNTDPSFLFAGYTKDNQPVQKLYQYVPTADSTAREWIEVTNDDTFGVVKNAAGDPIYDDNYHIRFSWLVGRHACEIKGKVRFIVCLKLTDDQGVITNEFNTAVHEVPVLEGLETSEAIVQEREDIIEAILLRMDKIESIDIEGGYDRVIEVLDSIPEDYSELSQDVSDLKDDLLKIFSDDAKAALLDCFAHVAWIGTDGRDYYDALEDALYDDIVLPEGYETSKYIEGTGQQYIETPINSAIPMELEVELNFAEIDNGIYFGASNGGNSRFFFLGTQQYRPTDARMFFSNRFSDTNYTDPDTGLARAWLPLMGFELATNRKYIVKSGIAWNQDGVTTYIESEGYRAEIDRKIPTVGYPIILGGDFWGSSTFKGLKAKIYRCKIKSGNNTIFDGVPCKRDADNKYGLYDIVNNTFYASSGSADYIGGEE